MELIPMLMCAVLLIAILWGFLKKGKASTEPACTGTISEPVLSFVKTVKENPKRFAGSLIDLRDTQTERLRGIHAWIYDKKEKENFTLKTGWFDENSYKNPLDETVNPLSWLTKAEINYLVDELTPTYKQGQLRLEKYTKLLEQRAGRFERKRLMEVYK